LLDRDPRLAASEDGVAFEARDDPPSGERPRHTTKLMPLIAQLLELSAIGWDQVDRIAVGIGPGTFTGLRIGIATARALSRARNVPLVGVSTLESLAMNAHRSEMASAPAEADAVLAVLDARRGEIFAAAWAADGDPLVPERRELLLPSALLPEALAAKIPELGSRILTIGEGAIEFREVLERSGALIPEDDSELHRVRAINHCRLATSRHASAPDEVGPEYLRLPDAEIARRAAGKS
jgi:tRNA threonylcarbamoyladenosine biosynthesis protein TsaB